MKRSFFSFSGNLMLLATAGIFVVTLIFIEPFLIYHNQQIGFSTGWTYFRSFLNYPGGIANYLAEFITQFFKFNAAGSLFIVLIAAFQGIVAVRLVEKTAGKTRFRFFVFAIILITGTVLLCDYRYPYYATVRLLLALTFTWFFALLCSKSAKLALIGWPALAALLFYAASGPAILIFGISTALLFIGIEKKKSSWIVLPLFILSALLIPWLANEFVFPTVLKNLFRLTEVKPPEMLAYSVFYFLLAHYLLLPSLLLIAVLSGKVTLLKTSGGKLQKKRKDNKHFSNPFPVIEIAQFLIIALLAVILFSQSSDPFKKKLVYLDYYAENQRWNEILKLAETINVYDFRFNYQVNRAYANLGTLSDNLFNYPQLLGINGLFLDTSSRNGSFTMPISDLYFDLGLMSESLRWAFEAQTLLPNSPRILKRIILISIINGKYFQAQEFLNILKKNILYREWVKKYQRYIDNPELAAADRLIAEKRSLMPVEPAINLGPLQNLKLLVDTNPKNRLAYDYLLSFCILDTNINDFISYAARYRYYGLKTLPRAWGEALAFYIVKNKSIPDFVTEETVDKADIDRMKAFNAAMIKYGNNLEKAKTDLRRNFENTYWYYLVFLHPKVTNVLETKSAIR